jgi:uncharacterized OsmC-like protein
MYKAKIYNKGDSKYYATTRHASLVLDTEGQAANPIDTLLASLCGCVGHYVRDYLIGNQIPHSGFAIDAEAGVTPDKASLAGINVCIDLNGTKLGGTQATEMLKFIENCKVHQILSVKPGVSISLVGH